MFTLDRENNIINHCIGSIILTIILAVFGAIYEHFAHAVYSYFMIYAFAVPLVMGALPYSIMIAKNAKVEKFLPKLWNSAIVTFSVGSVFKGVLQIYGTTNKLIIVYPMFGVLLCMASFLLPLIRGDKKSGNINI